MKNVNRSIDVKYLRTFSHVAKHKSFTAAAESLFMTQPAVSQHIKKIESTIGASIFDRKEGFLLTKHGKVLLDYADQTMSMYERLFEDLEKVELRDQFNIAIDESFCFDLVYRVINEFRMLNNIDLSIHSFTKSSSLELSRYDLIFTMDRISQGNGKSYQLKTVNYVIAYSCSLDPYECYPQRVVFCSSLSKSYVQELLNDYNVETSHVTSWVKTSSCQLLKNELDTNGTVLIFPEWSVCDEKCKTIPLRQKVNMYVWCSDEISQELETLGIKDKIQQLFQISDISESGIKHNIM